VDLRVAPPSAQLPNNLLLAAVKTADSAAPSPLLGSGGSVLGRGGSVLGPSGGKQSNRGGADSSKQSHRGGGDSEASSEYHTLSLFSHLRSGYVSVCVDLQWNLVITGSGPPKTSTGIEDP
jgi:hypothetical protein